MRSVITIAALVYLALAAPVGPAAAGCLVITLLFAVSFARERERDEARAEYRRLEGRIATVERERRETRRKLDDQVSRRMEEASRYAIELDGLRDRLAAAAADADRLRTALEISERGHDLMRRCVAALVDDTPAATRERPTPKPTEEFYTLIPQMTKARFSESGLTLQCRRCNELEWLAYTAPDIWKGIRGFVTFHADCFIARSDDDADEPEEAV